MIQISPMSVPEGQTNKTSEQTTSHYLNQYWECSLPHVSPSLNVLNQVAISKAKSCQCTSDGPVTLKPRVNWPCPLVSNTAISRWLDPGSSMACTWTEPPVSARYVLLCNVRMISLRNSFKLPSFVTLYSQTYYLVFQSFWNWAYRATVILLRSVQTSKRLGKGNGCYGQTRFGEIWD